jgi:hypothetical protein
MGVWPVPPLEDEEEEEEEEEDEDEELDPEPPPPPPHAVSSSAEIMQRVREMAGEIIPRACLIHDDANNSKSRARDTRIRRDCERSHWWRDS